MALLLRILFLLLILVVLFEQCVIALESHGGQEKYLHINEGNYWVEFVAKSRSHEAGYQYSAIATLSIGPSSMLKNIHAIIEDNSIYRNNIYEYTSSDGYNDSQLITYLDAKSQKEKSCYYSDWLNPNEIMTISNINYLIQSFKFVHKATFTGKEIFDKTARELLTDNSLLAWLGSTATKDISSEEEHFILFTDMEGTPKFLLGQHLLVHFQKFVLQAGKSEEYETKLYSTSKQLRNKCISLLEELYPFKRRLLKNNTNVHQKKRSIKSPWFANREDSCNYHYVGDEILCRPHRKRVLQSHESGKVCVFLHGAGNLEDNMAPTKKFIEYWGHVTAYTQQCSKHLFIRADTKNNGWDSRNLQIDYCNLAAFHNQTPTANEPAIIRNTIIFTHSMGNLILAAGIKNGYCQIDKNTSKWYAIDAPFGGSHASIKVQQICENYHKGTSPFSLKSLYGFIATKSGYCKPDTGEVYYAYKACHPEYCNNRGECISDLGDVILENVDGLMCGLSPIGLMSEYSILLQIVATLVDFGEENDGLLSKSSCEKFHGSKVFSNDFRLPFYHADLNHSDGCCRNGNGMFSDNRKPCSFYSYRIM